MGTGTKSILEKIMKNVSYPSPKKDITLKPSFSAFVLVFTHIGEGPNSKIVLDREIVFFHRKSVRRARHHPQWYFVLLCSTFYFVLLCSALFIESTWKNNKGTSPLLCPCAFFVLRSRLDPRPWAQLNLDAARIELATFSFTIDCYNHEATWATGLEGCDKSSIRKSKFLMNDNTSPKICFAGGCGFSRLHWLNLIS